MLDPFAQLFQHCWGHARSLRMVYKDLWVVSFPGTNIVGSCCIRLHTTANTHATTPNIIGATMLGVVAPVCTQPKSLRYSSCLISKVTVGRGLSTLPLTTISLVLVRFIVIKSVWHFLGSLVLDSFYRNA